MGTATILRSERSADTAVGARRSAWWWGGLFGLFALVVFLKAGLAFSLAEVFFAGEELEKGTVAKAILDRLPVPHYQLAYHYYEGGGFTVSHLTALAFLCVGENLLAHKLVSLGFNLAILAVGVAFTNRQFGRAAATFFGLLFALAPIGFQKISLLNLGIHYESSLFLLLVFAFALAALARGRLTHGIALGLGLSAGFGIYFGYQSLPAVAFVGAVLAWRIPGFLRQTGPLVAAGLVGLLPLFAMWYAAGDAIFDIHGSPLLGDGQEPADSVSALDSVRATFASLWGPKGIVERLALLLRWGLPWVALALYFRDASDQRAQRAANVLCAYLAFFAGVYLLSSFQVGEIYNHFMLERFSPFWCVGTVLSAAALGRMFRGGRGVRAAAIALGGLLLFDGAKGWFDTVRSAQPNTLVENVELLARTKGYSYAEYFRKFQEHLPEDPAHRLEVLSAFDEPDRALLVSEASQSVFTGSKLPRPRVIALLQTAYPEEFEDAVLGLGSYVMGQSNGVLRALGAASSFPDELQPLLFEAVGRRGPHLRHRAARLAEERDQYLGHTAVTDAYLRGYGRRVYFAFRLDPRGAEEFLTRLDATQRPAATEGYRVAVRQHLLPVD